MAIWVTTADPDGLLEKIKDKIADKKIATWECDKDGDFVHSASSGQWRGKTWLRPAPEGRILVFNAVKPKSGLKRSPYAVYHGRFIEMLIEHFYDDFVLAAATPHLTVDEK